MGALLEVKRDCYLGAVYAVQQGVEVGGKPPNLQP
jgi:hypothetical protein